MKLYLIRHGRTDWNEKGKIQGSTDIELNEEGIRQAEEMSRKVLAGNYNISKIYSSKQKRALKTAEILSSYIDVPCKPIDGLEEMNLGKWQGLSWEEVEVKYPEEYKTWLDSRSSTKIHGGESYEELVKRSLSALRKIMSETTKDVAVVTHNAVIMCLQCYITNTPFEQMNKFKCSNSSIVEIDSSLLFKNKRIIILRGNSGSGKTTIAKRIQKHLGKGTMCISQDIIRREMLYVDDGTGTKAADMINNLIKYGHENCETVILEGILNAEWYKEVFENIKELYKDNVHAYYFDLPFEETLLRHQTKPNCNDFGEDAMRRWFKEKDFINIIDEHLIGKDSSEEETFYRILEDIKER